MEEEKMEGEREKTLEEMDKSKTVEDVKSQIFSSLPAYKAPVKKESDEEVESMKKRNKEYSQELEALKNRAQELLRENNRLREYISELEGKVGKKAEGEPKQKWQKLLGL